ncbi:MAG TPA: Crp/Fnr family transcriptional regulator [Candidatus Paenibacillus intestinavium]|nr:Crp/Fnr family transcriptional regulator [Candidatus Paenibacillus intestinavium]
MKKIDTIKLRDSIPFFQDIDQQLLDQLTPYMKEVSFSKGNVIFHEGDEGNQIFFIRIGMVSIYTSNKAKRITLAYLDQGEYFGEMALMQPGLFRSATAEAMTTVKAYALHRADFQQLVEKERNVSFLLLNYTMERLRKANQQIHDLTFLNVQHRIIRRLIDLCKEFGRSNADDTYKLTVKITHQQLADTVGAARETVSKVLIDLQDQQLIIFENKKLIVLQLKQLEQKIEGWYYPSQPIS